MSKLSSSRKYCWELEVKPSWYIEKIFYQKNKMCSGYLLCKFSVRALIAAIVASPPPGADVWSCCCCCCCCTSFARSRATSISKEELLPWRRDLVASVAGERDDAVRPPPMEVGVPTERRPGELPPPPPAPFEVAATAAAARPCCLRSLKNEEEK